MLELIELEEESDDGDRILLVDDNATNLQVLYKTLDISGYNLLVAKDGPTALGIAEKAQPQLILLDIRMPGMDGFEVCRRLKDNPATRDIAVIFLSAENESDSKIKGLKLGAVDYITKPFDTDEVVARVHTHVKIRRLEAQLARRNTELEDENRQILDSVEDGILGINRKGVLTFMNPCASRLTGWSASDAVGEPVVNLGLFGGRSRTVREESTLLYPCYHAGERVRSEREMLHRNNDDLVSVSVHASPMPSGGAVVVLRDITQTLESQAELRRAREELERQRQTMAHIERLSTGGEMAAGIAHEVNQPLTAIGNYGRVAQRMLATAGEDGDIDRKQLEEVLEKMCLQSTRAAAVIDRFRGYLRKPGEGREPLDLNTALRTVISLAEVDSRINSVEVQFRPINEMPMIMADAIQIQQVALNLLRNAMEAMQGTASQHEGVTVETWVRDQACGFSVIDRGSGISDAQAEKLFTPFSSSKPGGMGVGLSISDTIIQGHGGNIEYRRNPDGGAIFDVRLPTID